jgi:type II secretory pathway pseudopilin PulG
MKPISFKGLRLQDSSSCFEDPSGYLLAEVMISIAIFSIGFVAVGTLILSTTKNNTNANILTQATLLAVETLENLKEETVLNLAVGSYSDGNNPIDELGNIGGIFNRSWVIDDPIGYDTARRIRVTVSWNRLGANRAIELTSITRGDGT